MLSCEIAGLSFQNRDDLVRRNGDRVRETWLAVIELDEIERRIVEDDAAEHVAVGEKAKIILGEGSDPIAIVDRSEEHTSELQSLMRISYAVFCLKKKKCIRNTVHNRR